VLNESGAREQPDASAERWRRGTPLSPIVGMPIGIKDVRETKDMPTQYGRAAYSGDFPKRDNAAVWALRQAGAVVIGKTVTTELARPRAWSHHQPVQLAAHAGRIVIGLGRRCRDPDGPCLHCHAIRQFAHAPGQLQRQLGIKPSQGAINRRGAAGSDAEESTFRTPARSPGFAATATTTMPPSAAASPLVAADARGPSSATVSASVSGPRELLSTTWCPAATASRAMVLPNLPLPMNPTVIMPRPTRPRDR
jgi:hypothetical protein